LAHEEPINPNFKIPNPNWEPPAVSVSGFNPDMAETKKDDGEPRFYTVSKYTFTVQFVWQEKRLSDRLAARKAATEPAAAGPGAQPGLPSGPVRPAVTPTGLPQR
jgi:hypothetical protein